MTHRDVSTPFISVVVPVYNGEAVIKDCLESLLALDYPKDRLELVIIDNNSTDRTPAIIRQYPVTLLSEAVLRWQRGEKQGDQGGERSHHCVYGR